MNILLQMALAVPLESSHHWCRIIIIYLSGVTIGALGHAATNQEESKGLIGASAGVYALLTANIAFLIKVNSN